MISLKIHTNFFLFKIYWWLSNFQTFICGPGFSTYYNIYCCRKTSKQEHPSTFQALVRFFFVEKYKKKDFGQKNQIECIKHCQSQKKHIFLPIFRFACMGFLALNRQIEVGQLQNFKSGKYGSFTDKQWNFHQNWLINVFFTVKRK